jgi:hypothetical protein
VFFTRSCLECRLHQHVACLRKRHLKRCSCRVCWVEHAPADIEVASVPMREPVFAIFGFVDVGGPLVLASQTVIDAKFKRERPGTYSKGPLGARLLDEWCTVVCQMHDFTLLRGEFQEIMQHMWTVLSGERPG